MGLQPLLLPLFCSLALREAGFSYHTLHTITWCIATDPKATGLTDHGLKPPKLKAQISLFSLLVYYLSRLTPTRGAEEEKDHAGVEEENMMAPIYQSELSQLCLETTARTWKTITKVPAG